MSLDRRLSVLPSVMSSVRQLDTRVEVRLGSAKELADGWAARYVRGGQCVDFGLHQGLTAGFVGIAVGIDNVLVDTPCDLEGNVAIAGEQVG